MIIQMIHKVLIYRQSHKIQILKQSLKKLKLSCRSFQNKLQRNSKKTSRPEISAFKIKMKIEDKINMKEEKIKDNRAKNLKIQMMNKYQKEIDLLFTYQVKATQWRAVKIEKANNG